MALVRREAGTTSSCMESDEHDCLCSGGFRAAVTDIPGVFPPSVIAPCSFDGVHSLWRKIATAFLVTQTDTRPMSHAGFPDEALAPRSTATVVFTPMSPIPPSRHHHLSQLVHPNGFAIDDAVPLLATSTPSALADLLAGPGRRSAHNR
ncbi:hypothetical protein MIND_01246000 [Mycena indigotica]|uniref:Uncharacterized protein n=1 Tax=Mycena indigotica TaxID=2126181 RepID=A0A8H6VSB8_9AGAR|nr:uncharacterized protein MIND_01246000 [Mycena indigotica]KAF7292187.1 hypothetical protein MIND_01246000 [Mycena indigotica]